jgi:hypothetical protein
VSTSDSAPTTPGTRPGSLPPDPAKFDTPRNVRARARGLRAPYIPGGEDPELTETLRRERRLVRLLVGMAVAIVASGFVLGIIGAILAGGRPA